MSFDYRGIHGLDVSFYQDANSTPQGIDFRKMKAAGASFVVIRAGQNTWEDEDFKRNYAAAKEAGLPRGVYFFYDSRVPPEAQAVLCASLIAGDHPEIGVWLDLEENYNGKYKGWQNWKLCLNKLKQGIERVGIYTGPGYWNANKPPLIELPYFKTFPLWIANYDVLQPAIPVPWTDAILWQIGTPAVGEQYGCESVEVDMNYFNGDPIAFLRFSSFAPSIPPTEVPQNGETMDRWKVTWDAGCNKRPEPNTSNIAVGVIPDNTEFDVIGYHVPAGKTPEQERWGRLVDLNWVALTYNSQVRAVLVSAPPPPVEIKIPDYLIAHFPDGTQSRYLPE